MSNYRDISKELDLVEFVERGLTRKAKRALGINQGNIFHRVPWRIKAENYLFLNVIYMQWSTLESSFKARGRIDLVENNDG